MNIAAERLRVVNEALSAVCVKCAGWGRATIFAAVGGKVVRRSEVCPACHGTGLQPEGA